MEFGQTPKQLFKTQHPQKFLQGIPRTCSLVQDSAEVADTEDAQNLSDDVIKRTNSGMFTGSNLLSIKIYCVSFIIIDFDKSKCNVTTTED